MYSKTLIAALIIIIGIAGGVFLAQRISPGKSKEKTETVGQLNTNKPKTAAILSNLPGAANRTIGAFIQRTIQDSFYPAEVKIQKVAGGRDGRGDENAGQWTANNASFNVLFVPEKQGSEKAAYIRLWTMRSAEALTDAKAASFLSQYFSTTTLTNAGAVSCKAGGGKTICDSMNITKEGAKVGVLVRDDVTLPNGTKAVVVSACEIPAGSPVFKDTTFCF